MARFPSSFGESHAEAAYFRSTVSQRVMYLHRVTTTSGFRGARVFKHARGSSDGPDAQLAVNMPVRVYPGTDAECRGVIVEDFGELAGQAVHLAGIHIDPARRWAVQLETGNLVFADTGQLVAE